MELMLAVTEYAYFKPAAGVPPERSNHNPFLNYERNKKCTSINIIINSAVMITHFRGYACGWLKIFILRDCEH